MAALLAVQSTVASELFSLHIRQTQQRESFPLASFPNFHAPNATRTPPSGATTAPFGGIWEPPFPLPPFVGPQSVPSAIPNPMIPTAANFIPGPLSAGIQMTPAQGAAFFAAARPPLPFNHALPGDFGRPMLPLVVPQNPNALSNESSDLQGSPKEAKPTAKKRAPSAFMLFCREKRNDLRTSQPNLTFSEIGMTLGNLWKAMSEEEKAHYKNLADLEAEKT